jgi:hypothetical protein
MDGSAVNAEQQGTEGAQSGKALGLADLAKAYRTSLIPVKHLTLEEWKDLGERICVINNGSGWWIGDWLVFGESRFPGRYEAALQGTMLDYQTLKNYAWIARKFHASRRRERLSIQHHIEVAALPESEQEYWLDRAEAERWPKSELRRRIRQVINRSRDDNSASSPWVSFRVPATANQQLVWNDAAATANMPYDEWIVMVLDAAAAISLAERKDFGSHTSGHAPEPRSTGEIEVLPGVST